MSRQKRKIGARVARWAFDLFAIGFIGLTSYGLLVQRTSLGDRQLTPNEKKWATAFFGDQIDIHKVRKKKAFSFFNKHIASVSNDRNIVFWDGDYYADDFTKTHPGKQHVFTHELTHIWQKQIGNAKTNISAKGIIEYTPIHGQKFSDYGDEQQANMVADYIQHFHSKMVFTTPIPTSEQQIILRDMIEEQFPRAKQTRLKQEKQNAITRQKLLKRQEQAIEKAKKEYQNRMRRQADGVQVKTTPKIMKNILKRTHSQ